MKKIFNCIFIAGLVIVTSCGGNDKTETELNADINAVNSIQNDSTATATSSTNSLPIQNQPSQPVTITPSTITPLENNTAGVKLNPAHGQPGHDCAIAVGAPLNSSVSKTTPTITTPTITTPATNGLPAKITVPPITGTPPVPLQTAAVGPGLNPAHGQPGHRCDLAVGAALPKQ